MAQTFDTTLEEIATTHGTLERRIVAYPAFEEGLIPLRRIAAELRLKSTGHVSSLVRRCRDELVQETAVRDLIGVCRGRMRRGAPPFLLARYGPATGARSYHRAPARSRR